MKVLFIAPEVKGLPKLDTWNEIDQIGDMPNVTLSILAGEGVTRSRVKTRLKQNNRVLIFAGHGEPGKLFVADGCLTARWLAQYIPGAKPEVVVLASCSSLGHRKHTTTSLAEVISGAGVNVIAMPTEVDDDGAAIYTTELIGAFSNGADLYDAHGIAQEQMETLTDSRQI
ncbi:unnamed protein product, partial [marine sediment metagenome]